LRIDQADCPVFLEFLSTENPPRDIERDPLSP
jgi:hypothetical protein